jgi:hypothetical protein
VWDYDVSSKHDGVMSNAVVEWLSDEDPTTACQADPRNLEFARYTGQPAGKRGDPVWFAALLSDPGSVSRILFRQGPVTALGGWFDTSRGRPKIQIARQPLSKHSMLNSANDLWEDVGELSDYPQTSAEAPPEGIDGRAFSIAVKRPGLVHAVRVVGASGGGFVACAEISAWGPRLLDSQGGKL